MMDEPKGLLRWFMMLPGMLLGIDLGVQKKCLEGKVVLITGASSGIGEAIAHKLYSEGCRLILMSRKMKELNRVKDDLLKKNISSPTYTPHTMTIDIADLDDIPSIAEKALAIYGHIDILVNNAGVSYRGLVMDTDIDLYMKVMKTNYFGQIALTKAIMPQMKSRKSGHIVFMGSMQAKLALPCRSAYGASKAALQSFVDSMRAEVASFNISVSIMCPSYVKTTLSHNALTSSGEVFGKRDKSTEKGIDPVTIAEDVVFSLVYKRNEISRGPLFHWLCTVGRVIIPSLYFRILLYTVNGMIKELG